MSNGIEIGKVIYAVITTDSELSNMIGENIYPIIAEPDTPFPFITYTRSNIYVVNQSKDFWFNDELSFNIQICDDDYMRSCHIANLIRDLFENKVLSADDMKVYNIRMTGISEMWSENAYVQSLNFSCNVE